MAHRIACPLTLRPHNQTQYIAVSLALVARLVNQGADQWHAETTHFTLVEVCRQIRLPRGENVEGTAAVDEFQE